MFIIHGLWDDHYTPLVFFLLPNKQKTSYALALNYAIEESQKIGKVLAPTTVVVGFYYYYYYSKNPTEKFQL
jgi:hypothetical protein